MPDDEVARKIRAKRLKEQIDRLTTPGKKPEEESREEGPANESPRDFIHRKMREWGKDRGTSR
ncbi:MAG TPA: hypothetical protein VFI90_00515 [Rubrobacter sp.]|nr:hypothetical protein [Rubrobacter sp.]